MEVQGIGSASSGGGGARAEVGGAGVGVRGRVGWWGGEQHFQEAVQGQEWSRGRALEPAYSEGRRL